MPGLDAVWLSLFFVVLAILLGYFSLKLRRVRTDRYAGVWFERGKKISPSWSTAAYVLAIFTCIISAIELIVPGGVANAPLIGGLLTATGSVVLSLAIAQITIWTFILIDRFK